MSLPLVSIVIPYYKRREVIGLCLDSVLQQDYAPIEMILVDNHSEDDVREIARTKDPCIRLIELPANGGACAARNAGIREARGEFLIFIDDDMGFMSPFEVTKAVRAFDAHPEAHALAFRVCDPDTGRMRLREWCHARYWKDFSDTEFETLWFCEGSVAFRREAFDKAGLYYERLFYGSEGWDLILRLFAHGFRIVYCPQLRTWHRPSPQARSLDRQYYYFTRSYVIVAYKDYGLYQGIRFLLPKLAMMSYFTVRTRAYRSFFRGLLDGFREFRNIRRERTPAPKAALKYAAALERWRPPLSVRLIKHRSKVEL